MLEERVGHLPEIFPVSSSFYPSDSFSIEDPKIFCISEKGQVDEGGFLGPRSSQIPSSPPAKEDWSFFPNM